MSTTTIPEDSSVEAWSAIGMDSIAMFGRSGPEQQRQATVADVLKDMQSTFNAEFTAWMDRTAQVYYTTGATRLTQDILSHIGTLTPLGNDLLNESQLYYIRSYAYSFARPLIEHHKDNAILA